MMKKILYGAPLLILLGISTLVWSAQSVVVWTGQALVPLLVMDSKNTDTLPRRYRQCTSPYLSHLVKQFEDQGIALPAREGLDDLSISGSSQFSRKQLEEIMKRTSGQIYIVDLREESHGYLNGDAVSWYQGTNTINEDCSLTEIMAREQALIEKLRTLKTTVVHEIQKKVNHLISQVIAISMPVRSGMSEAHLADLKNVTYVRFPVADHNAPTPEVLEQFISFYKSLPPQAHLVFHCRAGKGRTTFFMAVCDILNNGHQISFQDILQRQYLLGGRDILADSKPPAQDTDSQGSHNRFILLQSLYQQVTT